MSGRLKSSQSGWMEEKEMQIGGGKAVIKYLKVLVSSAMMVSGAGLTVSAGEVPCLGRILFNLTSQASLVEASRRQI